MAEQDEDDPMEEELTLSQIHQEFHINRGTLNNWLHQKKIPARKELSELGIEYYLVKRGEITKFLQNRREFGRPLKRS